MALDWTRWRRPRDKEPMARIRVDHYETRDDLVAILCASTEIKTGVQLSQRTLLQIIRGYLAAAEVLEPLETWTYNVEDEEADARLKWAEEQVSKL